MRHEKLILSKFFKDSISKYFFIDLGHTFCILFFFIVSLRIIYIYDSEVILLLKIVKWYYPCSVVPNYVCTEVAMKRVWQTVLQFVPVSAEQSFERMSHYQKTDAIV